MGAIQWLIYILSFFVPPFGFITFWVFARDTLLKPVAEKALIASFIGIVIWVILGMAGITLAWIGIGLAQFLP